MERRSSKRLIVKNPSEPPVKKPLTIQELPVQSVLTFSPIDKLNNALNTPAFTTRHKELAISIKNKITELGDNEAELQALADATQIFSDAFNKAIKTDKIYAIADRTQARVKSQLCGQTGAEAKRQRKAANDALIAARSADTAASKDETAAYNKLKIILDGQDAFDAHQNMLSEMVDAYEEEMQAWAAEFRQNRPILDDERPDVDELFVGSEPVPSVMDNKDKECPICMEHLSSKSEDDRIYAVESTKEQDEGVGEELCKDLKIPIECGHKFHRICIREWVKGHTKCPKCRAHILKLRLAKDEEAGAGAVGGKKRKSNKNKTTKRKSNKKRTTKKRAINNRRLK